MKSKSMGMYSQIPEESIQIALSTTCNVVQGWARARYFVQKPGDYFFESVKCKHLKSTICDYLPQES